MVRVVFRGREGRCTERKAIIGCMSQKRGGKWKGKVKKDKEKESSQCIVVPVKLSLRGFSRKRAVMCVTKKEAKPPSTSSFCPD